MKRKLRVGFLSLGILAFAGAAHAATLTLYPWSPGVAGVSGNTTTSAPGFADGSFQAGPVLDSSGKSEIYITPAELFGHDITIGQIASMSYWTNVVPTANPGNWTLELYTNKQAGDTSFYNSRLNAEPYLTGATQANGTWQEWSTNDPTNPLRFYDQPRTGSFGTYTDPTLSQIQNGGNTYTWGSGQSNNYSTETVQYLSFQTGSAWAAGFSGLLDGYTITLSDGETGTVNFEAVPLPSSAWAGLVLLAGLGGVKLLRWRLAV